MTELNPVLVGTLGNYRLTGELMARSRAYADEQARAPDSDEWQHFGDGRELPSPYVFTHYVLAPRGAFGSRLQAMRAKMEVERLLGAVYQLNYAGATVAARAYITQEQAFTGGYKLEVEVRTRYPYLTATTDTGALGVRPLGELALGEGFSAGEKIRL